MTTPTGLDYQAAYQAVYPEAAKTVRIQDVSDRQLSIIARVAQLVADTRATVIQQMKERVQ